MPRTPPKPTSASTIKTQNASVKSARQQRVLDGVAAWAGFYRCNPHRFAKDFLHLNLRLFQKILLVLMNINNVFVFIACRGIGKTYLSAIFCCIRCILYPGTKVCIASGTRGQSNVVLEKILTELRQGSPELAYEIVEKDSKCTGAEAQIMFKNGSRIKVVTAGDTARGNRAHILLIDEFRMVKKEVINTILKKFLSNPRHPKFMDKPEYKGKPEYKESLMTLYLSSAYYKDHWSYEKTKDVCRFMLSGHRKEFVCGFPYQLALQEELLSEERVIEDMTEAGFSEITWSMEMEAVFWGDSDGTFFNFETVSKNRNIQYPMLPGRIASKISGVNKLQIPNKQNGEKRILSADIALMSSSKNKNDATAIFVNQLLPSKSGRYSSNIIYTETQEGEHTEDQALRLRRLFEEYSCDYIVLDCNSVGIGVYDALVRDIVDPDTGEIYPAITCCNNPTMAARCTSKSAEKVIWAINGAARFNSDCAVLLREGFKTGKIRLLIPEEEANIALSELKGYSSLSPSEKDAILLPYVNTTLLISELINLQHEESGGVIRIVEKGKRRKDRYSSLSYNYWVACQLEQNIKKKKEMSFESKDFFVFRAPKIK